MPLTIAIKIKHLVIDLTKAPKDQKTKNMVY